MLTLQKIGQGFYGKNGAEQFYHRLNKKSNYSDGVKDFLTQANALWLYDIIETSLFQKIKNCLLDTYYLSFKVENKRATITLKDYLSFEIWSMNLDTCGVPDGKVQFNVNWDGEIMRTVLPCED